LGVNVRICLCYEIYEGMTDIELRKFLFPFIMSRMMLSDRGDVRSKGNSLYDDVIEYTTNSQNKFVLRQTYDALQENLVRLNKEKKNSNKSK
jgi:hypothetical protein